MLPWSEFQFLLILEFEGCQLFLWSPFWIYGDDYFGGLDYWAVGHIWVGPQLSDLSTPFWNMTLDLKCRKDCSHLSNIFLPPSITLAQSLVLLAFLQMFWLDNYFTLFVKTNLVLFELLFIFFIILLSCFFPFLCRVLYLLSISLFSFFEWKMFVFVSEEKKQTSCWFVYVCVCACLNEKQI